MRSDDEIKAALVAAHELGRSEVIGPAEILQRAEDLLREMGVTHVQLLRCSDGAHVVRVQLAGSEHLETYDATNLPAAYAEADRAPWRVESRDR